MTPDELYNRAVKQLNQSYTSGISCIESAETAKSVRFFRDFTQGEMNGIYEMSTEIYLAIIYNHDNEDKAGEFRCYKDFCARVRERSVTLRDQLIDYTCQIIEENTVE